MIRFFRYFWMCTSLGPDQQKTASVQPVSGQTLVDASFTSSPGSSQVDDDALKRACYVLRFLLADRSDIRTMFYRLSGRVAVIGRNENTNDIPEHANFPDSINQRARGLGATWDVPISTAAEENVLCLPYGQDP